MEGVGVRGASVGRGGRGVLVVGGMGVRGASRRRVGGVLVVGGVGVGVLVMETPGSLVCGLPLE